MTKLRVNQALSFSWQKGKLVLDGLPLGQQILNHPDGLLVLDEFSKPREPSEVIAISDDPELVEHAIQELELHGALICAEDSEPMPPDLLREQGLFHDIHKKVCGLTMSTPALNYALYKATEYISRSQIPGAIVEAGVWRGGSAMVCALTLKELGDLDRRIYLYDTFDGSWGKPSDNDGTIYGSSAEETLALYRENQAKSCDSQTCKNEGISVTAVKTALVNTGYPAANLEFVKGLVEETIPGTSPDRIALLRLDTDYFTSTYHELIHLFPRLSPGGILLIDDYPAEKGATLAVDRFFAETPHRIFLSRIDVQGRIGVKQA